jgi:dipeptidyl-peptidase-4
LKTSGVLCYGDEFGVGDLLLEVKKGRRFTLKNVFDSPIFNEKPVLSGQWMADNRRLCFVEKWPKSKLNTIWAYDSETREKTPLLDPRKLKLKGDKEPRPLRGHRWSPSERLLLFQGEKSGVQFVYDMETFELMRLTDSPSDQMNIKLSPDEKWLGFVRKNNIWVVSLETDTELQLTAGAGKWVYNGRFGWVYGEELGLHDGWSWSPDSTRIAYFQYDERHVSEFPLPMYDDLHTEPRQTRYPKAGDTNPYVRIGIVPVTGGETRWLDLDPIDPETKKPTRDYYIARMQWTLDGKGLLIQRLPRLQNQLELLYVDAETLSIRTVLEELDEAWVEKVHDVLQIEGTDEFLWPSERDGWSHYYLYNLSGECLRQITKGYWDICGIAKLNSETRTAYFTAALPNPVDRQVFRVSLDGGEPECMTQEEGSHSITLSKDCSRYIHSHSTINSISPTVIRRSNGEVMDTLGDATPPKLREFKLGKWELFTFTTSDGEKLWAKMLKPQNFDPTRKYPVLMYTYGGPGSQVVMNSWGGGRGFWSHMLAQDGNILFMTDNRGTGSRGRDFKKQTYLNLGKWEVNDQIEGAKYLASLPYVNPKRIGIWGWSYGGYMTCLCMLKGADVFKAGIAVAPVTDWALYDTIYTERYMRRPIDNPEGYKESAPVNFADKLKGKLMIVHGTNDDNVHFQNAARLATALQDANKPFEIMLYPGKDHGIGGRAKHLFTMMTGFIKRNL